MKVLLVGSRVAVAAALTLVISRPAFATDLDDAKLHYAKGTKAYEIGAYDEAIKEYGEAYRLIDDPALLYNLGQAHRLAGHSVEALRAYRMFLLKVPSAPNRGEVQDRIADLQRQTPLQPRPATQPSPTEPESSAPPPIAPAPVPAPSVMPARSSADPVAASAARKKLVAGGVVAGAGLLVAVGGIVSGVFAEKAGDDITTEAQMKQPFDYNKYQVGKTDQALEIALLAVGGVAVVAGVTVMILGKRQSSRAHASIQPLIGSHSAGFAVGGGF